MIAKKIKFTSFDDERGSLVAIEGIKNVPFEIKRIYYISKNKKNFRRGFHAHKNLKQVLICVNGSCMVHLDNGFETEEILLNNSAEGLYLENNIWREMYNFSDDAVLLVLASEYYDESDYIRKYDDFLKFINKEK